MPKESYVIYKRLSRESKSGNNLGLDAQQSAIDNFFQNKTNYTILETFEEIETGTNKKQRPQLIQALQLCKQHNATLLIAKLDRLARNVHFISGLMESKVNFLALDLKEANPLTIHILAAVAEAEAKTIAARTSAALQELKKQGKPLGTKANTNRTLPQAVAARAQYNASKSVKAHDFAKKVYPSIAYFASQGLNQSQIAVQLNNLGHISPSGREAKWSNVAVSRILKRVEIVKF